MLISDLKLLLRFNSSSAFEEVSQTNLIAVGDSVVPLIDSSGYTMQESQYLVGTGLSENGFNLNISSSMTIGFWLYPVHTGIAVNADTGEISSVEKPLFDFVDIGSALNSIIKITEHTSETGNNYLKISIEEGNYEASSEEYAVSQWHYFWIVYKSSSLSLYVDGVEHTLQETGSLSSSIAASNLYLYINHSLTGYSWKIAKNTGIIDDLFVLNVSDTNEVNIQRAINDGIRYVVNDDFIMTDIDKQSIYFNDPKTITINSLIDDMNYVFVGRNDGKILRGSPLLWEVRRVFAEKSEIEDLKLDPVDFLSKDGFLKINNKTVRL